MSSSGSSKSYNSYRLLSSSSSSLSSITTVSSQLDHAPSKQNSILDSEQWPAPPAEVIQPEQNIVQDTWRIEKKISLKDQQLTKNSCIVKATMTNEQIIISDSSSTRSRIIPGKHITMKVVFRV
ncbi:unnamed protein product [Rotaria magnacalcarata]|uniref:Uncharacterized protein n=1 Tax=Rotaria magnacalcarata TaxID=392030 RepID=A0A816NKI1_9BILA|nr:unnamed protein product [Rotaria magnacalcarata]CAF1519404.1 unnamed protein product [Rotaria magnacalcarata]CAF2035876.1 unnamed protein product [Rotaria magnacalcarata]CAF2097022.1 unnamed protein product [Rotaria magnacalcarata]CAF2146695.1 unnamed protein product [Rotaria magnacalcarata]